MTNERIHVSIVGKSEIVREGLTRILIEEEFSIDCAVSSVDDLDMENGTSLVIVDTKDVDASLAVCAEIRDRHPQARTVIMADEYGMDDVSRAFATGTVDGYLVKEISCRPL